jgi:hypothetical protein
VANKNILLIEPGYKNKYPPLGLMKIAQYHGPRGKNDRVRFIKGEDRSVLGTAWDTAPPNRRSTLQRHRSLCGPGDWLNTPDSDSSQALSTPQEGLEAKSAQSGPELWFCEMTQIRCVICPIPFALRHRVKPCSEVVRADGHDTLASFPDSFRVCGGTLGM